MRYMDPYGWQWYRWLSAEAMSGNLLVCILFLGLPVVLFVLGLYYVLGPGAGSYLWAVFLAPHLIRVAWEELR